MRLLPIVTWSGKVHYRHASEPTQFDAWDRSRSDPLYAALCNPNTIGREPIVDKSGVTVAPPVGVEAMTPIADLSVCLRCAKKVAQ